MPNGRAAGFGAPLISHSVGGCEIHTPPQRRLRNLLPSSETHGKYRLDHGKTPLSSSAMKRSLPAAGTFAEAAGSAKGLVGSDPRGSAERECNFPPPPAPLCQGIYSYPSGSLAQVDAAKTPAASQPASQLLLGRRGASFRGARRRVSFSTAFPVAFGGAQSIAAAQLACDTLSYSTPASGGRGRRPGQTAPGIPSARI